MGEIYTMILTQNVTFEFHVNISVVCYLKNVVIDVIMYVLCTHFSVSREFPALSFISKLCTLIHVNK